MALRAFIYLAKFGENTIEKIGDPVFLKLPGGPVGRREWMEYLIVDNWVDDEWELELRRLHAAAPHLHHTIFDPYGEHNANGVLVRRSLKRVNIDVLADKADVLNPKKAVAAKDRATLTMRADEAKRNGANKTAIELHRTNTGRALDNAVLAALRLNQATDDNMRRLATAASVGSRDAFAAK